MKFTTILHKTGTNTTGIVVPPEILDALGGGKKPKVNVILNGFAYRSSIAVMGGTFMIPVSADIRAKAGVNGGEEATIELSLDTAPREVAVPDDFAAALAAAPVSMAKFEALSYSNKSRHVLSVEGTKNPETRLRRIAKAIEELAS